MHACGRRRCCQARQPAPAAVSGKAACSLPLQPPRRLAQPRPAPWHPPVAGAPSPRGSAAPGRRAPPRTARASPAGQRECVLVGVETGGKGWCGGGRTATQQATAAAWGTALPLQYGQAAPREQQPQRGSLTGAAPAALHPTTLTWKAGPVKTRCLVIWCRRCTTVPSAAQCTPMRMRGPLRRHRRRRRQHGRRRRVARAASRRRARLLAHPWTPKRSGPPSAPRPDTPAPPPKQHTRAHRHTAKTHTCLIHTHPHTCTPAIRPAP